MIRACLTYRDKLGQLTDVRSNMSLDRTPLLILVICSLVASADAADLFKDKALEAVVRETLKKGEKDELKEADLKDIYIMNGDGRGITDLSGLEKCPNMAQLRLAGNKIKDLKPIAGLVQIQSLDLSRNQLADIAPVAKLTKLQYLKLDRNQISKIDGVKELSALRNLYLEQNKVSDLAPVGGLKKLVSLYLTDNQISDLKPLAKSTRLASLDLKNNKVSDLSPLKDMNELRYTFLQGNQIKDLGVIVEMAKKDIAGPRRFAPYWNVYVAKNPLSDAAKGKQVAELKKLGVRLNQAD